MVNNQASFAQAGWLEFEDTTVMRPQLHSEHELASAATHLGARSVPGWSSEEEVLGRGAPRISADAVRKLRDQIRRGEDPLGDAFCELRSPAARRDCGATYTPRAVAEAMVCWAGATGFKPVRIVDPGTGSGRFLIAASRIFPRAELFGIEKDPLAGMIARANLAVLGLAARATILVNDYLRVRIPRVAGHTLYVGNPPYVRHHRLDEGTKAWLTERARTLGLRASQLAGLHVHFFLATALHAQEEDFGAFITSAEWLDVNYGKLVRSLFLNRLGGQGITIVEPTSRTFSDAATTSAITQFRIGSRPEHIRLNRSLDASRADDLMDGRWLKRERFSAASRWSVLTRRSKAVRDGWIELGELCRVHRGQVTGANRVWIAGEHSFMLPESVLFPSVTRAKELFDAGETLTDTSNLRDVIDIPSDLSVFSGREREKIEAFLARAKMLGADSGYIARARRTWWSVGLRTPAPILATYMARRKPVFVRNLANARHINIAHGIYPRENLTPGILNRIAQSLCAEVSRSDGRTYAGGLTKFEPKEMERIQIPNPLETEPQQVA